MASYNVSLNISADQLSQLLLLATKQGINVSMTAGAPVAGSAPVAEPQAKGGKKIKKAKKEKDPNAPKREPNDWVKFTSRVRAVLKADMEGETTTNKKGETVPRVPQPKEVTQTASALKAKDVMATCSDEDILEAFRSYEANPPAVSKMVLEGRDAASRKAGSESGSQKGEESEEEAEASEAESESKVTEKPKRKWSEEAKKAAAEKRAAKKASKSSPAPAAETAAVPEVKKATPPAAPEPKAAAEDFDAEEEDEEDPNRAFAPWTFKKTEYLKNLRGDVLTLDQQWVGRFVEGKGINKAFPCPEDLGF